MKLRFLIGAAMLCASLAAHASCGAAFCTVNTAWDAQGAWTESGTRLDLRYELVRQDELRAGSDRIAPGSVARHHDELATRNRNLLVGLDHAFDAHWGLSASLPLVHRTHEHVHNHHGARLPQSWNFTEAGDLKLLGRYQLEPRPGADAQTEIVGLNFGVQLPTGEFDVRNAAGEAAERSLQPGSGTTDLLLGGYYTRQLPLADLSWFAQALAQHPLRERAGYRPGARYSADFGVRYAASGSVGLMLQANLVHRSRDRGAQAEPEDSGGDFAWLSPGVSWNVTRDLQLYGFLQLPVYQKVNGVQLTAGRALVLGASTRF